MLGLAIAVGFVAVVVGLIAFVVRFSGRRFPGDITGDQGNQVDYDDYYVGWNIFGKPPADKPQDDFTQWESEQRKRRE